ncbi:MAG TPA: sugar ABC transporter ATP-binding protein, partial [Phycisphaerae bacterium]|nr:sugar ABC transporter ATP-binding protein [Phycisphaerae bacterium]
MPNTPPRLEMRGICKRFGATVALDQADLIVQRGEVHALVGENGAGKSTLMRILAGAVRPDSGVLRLDGATFAPANPLEARAAGVAMIYQELNLAPHLTVEQNLTLGMERHLAGFIRRTADRRRIVEVFERLHRSDIRPETVVRRLSAADRQIVEIARALLIDARVLVLDEPTSSLSLADIERLFEMIARLRAHGVGVVYISHFLEEVRRVADRYTVLRDGRVVGTGAMSEVTMAGLVEMMIGRRLIEMCPRRPHQVGGPVLVIAGLSGHRLPLDVDLTLHRGEILGLAGLIGAGRTELLRCIFGLESARSGRVHVIREGKDQPLPRTTAPRRRPRAAPATRLAQGIGLLSEDRAGEGLALSRSIIDNLLLSRLGPFVRWGHLNWGAMRRTTAEWIGRLDIRARGAGQRVRDLSGGNQQKTALARLLHHDVDILLLDEPTRGIDVASKAQIYELIGALAARG